MLVNKDHPHTTDEEDKEASDLLKVKEETKETTFSLDNLPSPSALSTFLLLLYQISSTSQILSDKRCLELMCVCPYLSKPLGMLPH